MLLGFNGATSMKYDLLTDIIYAEKTGFDLLEIWKDKLTTYLQEHSLKELQREFAEKNIKPYSINSIENITFQDSGGFQLIKEECTYLCQIARELKCPRIVVVPGKKEAGMSNDEIKEESRRVLLELSDIAGRYQVELAFEFLGFADCSVSSLKLCNEIVESVARDNVGLVLDTFHFYAGGSRIEDIRQVQRDNLSIFHINDAEDLPREELQDADRLFPGEGIIPLQEILSELQGIGYQEMVSIELFRPEYWELPVEELLEKSLQSVKKVTGR